MKYGLAGVIFTLSLPRIVPFKWSSLTSLMTFFVSLLPVASFCPAVGAGEAVAAKMTESCAQNQNFQHGVAVEGNS